MQSARGVQKAKKFELRYRLPEVVATMSAMHVERNRSLRECDVPAAQLWLVELTDSWVVSDPNRRDDEWCAHPLVTTTLISDSFTTHTRLPFAQFAQGCWPEHLIFCLLHRVHLSPKKSMLVQLQISYEAFGRTHMRTACSPCSHCYPPWPQG